MNILNSRLSADATEVKSRFIIPFSYILVSMGLFNAYLYHQIYHAEILARFCIIGTLFALFFPFVKKRLSHTIAANYVISVFYFSLLAISLFTGGILSNAIMWFGTIPLLASFLLNAFYGVVWFSIIIFSFMTEFILGSNGLLPVSALLGAKPEGRIIISFTLNASLIFVLCVLAELIRDKVFTEKEEFKKKTIHLNQLASLGKLASGIAHEINNPLTVIKGSQLRISRMIEGNEEVNKEALSEHMLKIQKNISRIQEVTTLMRTVSEKAIDSTVSIISIEALIKDVLKMFTEEVSSLNIHVNLKILKKDLKTEGIYSELFQAFYNLIDNAVFELRSLEQPEKQIQISLNESDDSILIVVEDNGRGIPAAVRPRIFDPFFTTKNLGQGKGLGLSFSFNVFTLRGGSLDLIESPVGSVFRVTLTKKSI